jgi:hypothetical protein
MRRLLPLFLMFGFAASAHADVGMPLDHTHWLIQGGQAPDPLAQYIDADHIDGGKHSASAHSRIETELKIAVPDQHHFDRMRLALDKLAANPALAEKVLGKGWFVKYSHDADYGDVYLDGAKREMAIWQGGIRKRVVNGKNLELNVKPPGGLLTGDDGIISTRIERGLTLGPGANLDAIARTTSIWTPMSSLREIITGDLARLMKPSIANRAARNRYVIGHHGMGEGWERLIDLSADHVYETRDVSPNAKPKKGETPHIWGLEGDVNHPGSDSGLIIPGVNWAPPHKAADAHNPAFHADPAILALHALSPRLIAWMYSEHDVHTARALPKYTQAAINAGAIRASQVKPVQRR